jgi:AAA domain/DnaB-like helicase N terminal domain
VTGKTPPHDIDAEIAVLGGILASNPFITEAARVLEPSHFYRDAHQLLFKSMIGLAARGSAIDLVTLKAALTRQDLQRVGGPVYIAKLLDGVPQSSNVGHYAAIVRDAANRRALIFECERMIASAHAGELATDYADTAGAIDLVSLSDVTPEHVDFLWPGRIAKGKYALIAGDPGLGKSHFTIATAAHLSVGSPWPDGGSAPIGKTLMLSAEDGIADTIRQRAVRLGADASQIVVLRAIRDAKGERPLNLARDLERLKEAIVRVRPTLVTIDPITAYLGKTDSYKDSEVRGLLAPLIQLIADEGVALLAVGHLAKADQRAALHRPGGSVAFRRCGANRPVLGGRP